MKNQSWGNAYKKSMQKVIFFIFSVIQSENKETFFITCQSLRGIKRTAGCKDCDTRVQLGERNAYTSSVFISHHATNKTQLPPAHILLWPAYLCSHSHSHCLSHRKGLECLLWNITHECDTKPSNISMGFYKFDPFSRPRPVWCVMQTTTEICCLPFDACTVTNSSV